MRNATKSVQRPNPKYRTTFDSAMPLSYIASHYLDVYVNAKYEVDDEVRGGSD